MINTAVLVKYIRNLGIEDWPEYSYCMLKFYRQLLKDGFPGIGFDDVSLVNMDDIEVGDIFIADLTCYPGEMNGDEAPMMLKKLALESYYIIGIGAGEDKLRDPTRKLFVPGDDNKYIKLHRNRVVLRVDCRPTIHGGPGYHYFFRVTNKDKRSEI